MLRIVSDRMQRLLRWTACAVGKIHATSTSIGITGAAPLLSSLVCRYLRALLMATTIRRRRRTCIGQLTGSTIIARKWQPTTRPYKNVRMDGDWSRSRVGIATACDLTPLFEHDHHRNHIEQRGLTERVEARPIL